MKLLAFAVSGGMAALAGCLLVTLLPSNTPGVTFAPEESVKVVAIVVIGGLGALVGPVLGALWVVGVPAIWPDEPIVPFLVSGRRHPRHPAVRPRRLRRHPPHRSRPLLARVAAQARLRRSTAWYAVR